MQPGTIRALKILVVVMGVAIIAGTITLGILIARRLDGGTTERIAAIPIPNALPAGTAALRRQLDEPSGTSIAAIAIDADRLAIQLRGGGPDRVVLVDARTGATIARIAVHQTP